MTSYQKVQNFKCRCPLIQNGLYSNEIYALQRSKRVYGLSEIHQIPNIPCDRSLNDVFLNQHLQWYHNFDSVSSRKLVRAICNNVHPNQQLFSNHETVTKQNISVENYKCKCPLTHDGVFGLSDEHDVTNVPCGRAEKEVLCFQHLQYHHNLSSRAAKKIVIALLSYTPTVTRLFHQDDLVTQSKCAVRKFKSRCPLIARHLYGLHDHHQVANVPCDRSDQEIFLFPHLTYFHKLNGKAATKLIRALIIEKKPNEPLFHSNDIVVAHEHTLTHNSYKNKSTKHNHEKKNKKKQPTEEAIIDLTSHYQSLINAIQTSINQSNDNNGMMPLDCSRTKRQVSSIYSTNEMADAHGLDLTTFLT